ncbi:MAG: hypothetical protein KAR11_04230 [Phycisphaerae bacterium]|nr:hypothetical protein [Phycisphaerae bacterium]
MPNKRWFAWVPVLGERLLWPNSLPDKNIYPSFKSLEDHLKKEKSTAGKLLFKKFHGKIFDRLKPQMLQTSSNYSFCFNTERIDDTNKSETIRIIVFKPIRDNFYEPKYAFIAHNHGGGKDFLISTLATIEQFNRDGLYSFKLEDTNPPHIGQEGIERSVSGVHMWVRDFFHKHIHNDSDYAVVPVYTSDPVEAVRVMWEGYFGGLVGIHGKRATSDQVSYIRSRKTNHDTIIRTFGMINNYIGKCRYGKSFCSKFLNVPTPPNTHLNSTHRLQETFLGFYTDLDSFVTTKAAKDAFKIGIIAIFIAIGAFMVSVASPFWTKFFSPPTPPVIVQLQPPENAQATITPQKKAILEPSGDTKNLGQATSTSRPTPAGKSEDTISRID